VATDRSKAGYRVAEAGSTDKAQHAAWDKCKAKVGEHCHDWVWGCSWDTK